MTQNEVLGQLMSAALQPSASELEKIGKQVGRLYTDHGLPVDMALNRLPYNREMKLVIIHGACQWFMEHKRKSGATDKAIERQRATNLRMIESFLTSGEVGIY